MQNIELKDETVIKTLSQTSSNVNTSLSESNQNTIQVSEDPVLKLKYILNAVKISGRYNITLELNEGKNVDLFMDSINEIKSFSVKT
jgi:hypothetical protein